MTAAAQSLVGAVLDVMLPYLTGSRPLGAKGKASLARDTGVVLAAILRPGLEGCPVRVGRSPSAPLWNGAHVGQHRFWRLIDALAAAGLVGCRLGVRFTAPFDTFGGKATVLWPTGDLVALAAAHGVTVATRREDWQADCEALGKPPKVAARRLVECAPLNGIVPLPLDADRDREAAMCEAVERLNAAVAGVEIRGCPGIAFQRRFQHSLDFGGRHYAVGGGYQTMPEAERLKITMDGAPVCEVDVAASQLTVLLGLPGRRELPEGDLYARIHPNLEFGHSAAIMRPGRARR